MTYFKLNTEHHILIPIGNVMLEGILYTPEAARGLVLFVHGSGSSRFSVRNHYVANVLNDAKLATLLFDLFTPDEDAIDSLTRQFRFDIEFLATLLLDVTRWCLGQAQLSHYS